MVAPRRKISAVLTLLVVAPLIAEYLLGDLPLKLLPALIFLAPSYGGAAVLIRETARRKGRGWPTMLVLGMAYALLAEGLVTESLFNHDYLKMRMHLLDHAYLPALGIGAWWTLFMLNLHAFWSVGVSVALVEAVFSDVAEVPWLSVAGDSFIAVIFVLGMVANFGIGFKQNQFLASHAQLLSAVVLSALLVVAAFMIPAFMIPRRGSFLKSGAVPDPWATGAVTFLLGTGVLSTPPAWGWAATGAVLTLDVLFVMLVRFFSRRRQWNALHVLSLAAGGALAYGVHAFTAKPLVGGLVWMRISNTVFLAGAIWLIWLGARRVMNHQATANHLTAPVPGL